MRITLKADARGSFGVDGETLLPGESIEVSEERGGYLLARHADLLTVGAGLQENPIVVRISPPPSSAQPTSGTAPADPKE
jgi:hypothetical protein